MCRNILILLAAFHLSVGFLPSRSFHRPWKSHQNDNIHFQTTHGIEHYRVPSRMLLISKVTDNDSCQNATAIPWSIRSCVRRGISVVSSKVKWVLKTLDEKLARNMENRLDKFSTYECLQCGNVIYPAVGRDKLLQKLLKKCSSCNAENPFQPRIEGEADRAFLRNCLEQGTDSLTLKQTLEADLAKYQGAPDTNGRRE